LPDKANNPDFDVIIVGGGMVGAALACALAEAQFQVGVLEARAPQTDWPAEEVDLRVSALSRASQRILSNLGAWEQMAQMRISPYTDMHVWDAGGNGSIHFSAGEIGEPDLGHIVENRVTQLALWERLAQFPNVTMLCPARIAQLETGTSPSVRLEDGRKLQARLVVGADGRESLVRKLAGIASQGWDYDQHAIVATIRPQHHHQFTAWQRFMPTGPLALLPIQDGRCSIVWSTSPLQAQELMGLDEAAFCAILRQASENILGEILAVGPRGLFALRLGHAQRYVQPGLALVGDAAHAIHPLAGQGVNLGFLDAATLAQVLIEARKVGRELGAITTLRRYERARKGANLGMLGVMDLFKRFFSNEILPLQLLRNLGLSLVDHAGPVKDLVIRRAMGLSGELPDLAR
jgi:2-octaprenylphenol hydroxylase